MYENRQNAIKTIQSLKVPLTMIGHACGQSPKRVSDFAKGNPLQETVEEKILQTVEEIAHVWEAFSPFRVELNSPELLAHGLRIAEEIRLNREMHAAQEQVEQMLSAL